VSHRYLAKNDGRYVGHIIRLSFMSFIVEHSQLNTAVRIMLPVRSRFDYRASYFYTVS